MKMNLKVIPGGKQGEKKIEEIEGFVAKLKQLRKIQHRLSIWRGGFPARRTWYAFLGGAVAAVAASMILGTKNHDVVIAVLLSLMSFLAVKRYSKAPASHAAHIDQLLSDYKPVSKEAYRLLQDRIALQGMNIGVIEIWVFQEADAIRERGGFRTPKPEFLNNKI